MNDLSFVPSRPLTVGVELEWQLLDPETGRLSNQSLTLLDRVHQNDGHPLTSHITPEGVQNMVEINTTPHESVTALLQELYEFQKVLRLPLAELDLALAGGGTHPFESWTKREIFPKLRYLKLHNHYGFLFKRFSVYGEHVHIGCGSSQDALYLIHALSSYVPHFIALSAASPFYSGVDTFFECARLTMADAFPTSGTMPFITDWSRFEEYFSNLCSFKLIESMKDLYWDIRPKPEFGTIEIRVFDSPLTLRKAAALAAYVQALCAYLLDKRPAIHAKMYIPYVYNRFAAMRYGLKAEVVDAESQELKPLQEEIFSTLDHIFPYAHALGSHELLKDLEIECAQGSSDSEKQRLAYNESNNFTTMIQRSIAYWNQ